MRVSRRVLLGALAALFLFLLSARNEREQDQERLANLRETLRAGEGPGAAAAIIANPLASRRLWHAAADLASSAALPNAPWLKTAAPLISTGPDGDPIHEFGELEPTVEIAAPGALPGMPVDLTVHRTIPLVPSRLPHTTIQLPLTENHQVVELRPIAVFRLDAGISVQRSYGTPLKITADTSQPVFLASRGASETQNLPRGVPVVIAPGDSFDVVCRDPHGFRWIQYEFEGVIKDTVEPLPEDGPTYKIPLPPHLDHPKERRRVPFRVKAVNSLGNTASFEALCIFQCENWNPVLATTLSQHVLDADASEPLTLKAGTHPLGIMLEPDLLPEEQQGLSLRMGEDRIPITVEEGDWGRALVPIAGGASHKLDVMRGDRVLKSFAVKGDGEAPHIVLRTEDGELLQPGQAALFPGDVVQLVITDPTGLPTDQQALRAVGLTPGERTTSSTQMTARWAVPESGVGELRVQATDPVGNRTDELVWTIRARMPASLKSWTVFGQPCENGSLAVRVNEVPVGLVGEGEGELLLTVEDPQSHQILHSVPWNRRDERDTTLLARLGVDAGREATRLLRVRNREGRSLEAVEVLVDRRPPSMEVPGLDSARVLLLPRSQSTWVVRTQDLPIPPQITVSGAIVLRQADKGHGIREYTLSVPEKLPCSVALEARDSAGNRTVLPLHLRRP